MPIRPVELRDSDQIAEIYGHYVETSHSTFELDPPDSGEMRTRIRETGDAGYPFLVCEEAGAITGYAYGHRFRERPAYRFAVEVSVYLRPGYEGKQIGSRLYERLFAEIEQCEFHTVVAGISLPNEASVRLHERFGFTQVAHFREVGFKFDRWIDVGYWQKMI